MMNEKMIKFAQIRSSYTRKRFGTLNNEEKALFDYETFCLELIKENDDLQTKRDKAIEYIKNKWYSKNTRNIEELYSLGNWQIELLEILRGK